MVHKKEKLLVVREWYFAITADGKKIEVGQKVMRTKTGKTGKLQTVYQWSDDMKNCFDSK